MSFSVQVKYDTAAMSKVQRTLGGFEGQKFQKAAAKAMGVALRPWRGYLRSGVGGSGIGKETGAYARSVGVRKSKLRPGEAAAYTVGPRGFKKHWLARGHRIVTPGGRDTGMRSRAFPWLDDVVGAHEAQTVQTLESVAFATAVKG